MPLTDMGLAQLAEYKGTNPKPADFDAFWDKSVEQMRSIDPKIELVPRATNAKFVECFDLYFTGVNGARVHAKYLRPKNQNELNPALVMFHGYSGGSGEWTDKLVYVAQGYTVLAIDVRGQGGKSEDVGGHVGRTMSGHFIRGVDGGPEKMLFRDVFLDCAQLAGIAFNLPGVDPAKVYATGGSQGGALTIVCAALEPRVTRAAAWYPFLSDYKRVWEMDLAVAAYLEIREYFRAFDPLHEREADLWNNLGYIDIQHLAPRIKAETLFITCLMDSVCPPSTQFAVYNKISAPKDMAVYHDFGHEGPPGAADRVYEYLIRD